MSTRVQVTSSDVNGCANTCYGQKVRGTPSRSCKSMYASCRRRVIGPAPGPAAIKRPSISTTGEMPPIVPVVKASSAVQTSVSESRASLQVTPAIWVTFSMTILRVMPGRQESANGVSTTPPRTMKKFMALVSEAKPSRSSMSASSAPAWSAWILARILLMMLLWWILESRHEGVFRRMAEVISRSPAALFATLECSPFHSANTMRHGPDWLFLGLMPDVTFSPRVNVRRHSAPSRIPLACSVSMTARTTTSRAGTRSNNRALAEANKRSRCSCRAKIFPFFTRSPSHTASPACTELSKTETLASSRGTIRPPTYT
mmetsp:Transcript_109177/g.189174  ORF Transcript_109177/g.189174 Transcript_109177/m.189174 type:complete len:316 (+) Transcript_109177:428-1375(+)